MPENCYLTHKTEQKGNKQFAVDQCFQDLQKKTRTEKVFWIEAVMIKAIKNYNGRNKLSNLVNS